MKKTSETNGMPDKRLAAVCGLFCPACSLFISTREDPKRLTTIAARLQRSAAELQCSGCRSEKRCFYCASCKMQSCAAAKKIDFCGQCPEYPCKELREFQAQRPHRLELWSSQERIKKVGYETWYREMIEYYSCPECRTINSAYDLACRKCGAIPSCTYVAIHKDEIVSQSPKRT